MTLNQKKDVLLSFFLFTLPLLLILYLFGYFVCEIR